MRHHLHERERIYEKRLAEANAETVRANQAKAVFLTNISHDIRTPINAILGMLELAEQNAGEPEAVRRCHEKIRAAADQLLSMMSEVLELSRLRADETAFVKELLCLPDLLDECGAAARNQIQGDAVKLNVDFSGIVHDYVVANENLLRQIFLHLLSNAVKYTEQGTIDFTARELGSTNRSTDYEFIVADTGIGMGEEYQRHLFEEFSQENGGARTTYTGSGLGLAIVKGIVERLGGTIQVESKRNAGTTFRVTLNLLQGSPPEQAEICAEDVQPEKRVSGMHVLLVDDSEINLEITKSVLEHVNVTVDTAANGQEAVERFLASKPGEYDLILMDVMMPVMDGLAATRAIRSSNHSEAQSIPIFAQTANAFPEDVAAVLEAGMDEHIAKPLNVDRLLRLMSLYRGNRSGKE